MKVIVAGRSEGKTTRMLEWLASAPKGEHRVIVAPNEQESRRLYRENRERFESWQFVTAQEIKPNAWSGVLRGRGGRVVLGIDNLDLMLSGLVGREVGAVSLTSEEPS